MSSNNVIPLSKATSAKKKEADKIIERYKRRNDMLMRNGLLTEEKSEQELWDLLIDLHNAYK